MNRFNQIEWDDLVKLDRDEVEARLVQECEQVVHDLVEHGGHSVAVYLNCDGRIFSNVYSGVPLLYEDCLLVARFPEDEYARSDEEWSFLCERIQSVVTNALTKLWTCANPEDAPSTHA